MNVGQRGFTLVELLVALTVLAIMSALVLGSLRFCARSGAAIEQRVARAEHTALVRRFVRRQLEQVRATDGSPPLVAGAEHLEFTAPLAVGAALPGPHRIALVIENEPNASRLVLEYTMLATAGREAPVRKVLLSGMRAARWRYWEDAGRGPGQWAQQWRDLRRTPPLVRLEVDWPADSGRVWTDFVVAPPLAAVSAHGGEG